MPLAATERKNVDKAYVDKALFEFERAPNRLNRGVPTNWATGNHVWVHPLVGVLLKIALTPGDRVILPRMKIAELEHSTDWQATAEDRNKRPIAVMRTNKGKYRLYNGNWTATPYPNSYQFPEGRATHSADEVKAMFASGKLKLLKGRIPAKT